MISKSFHLYVTQLVYFYPMWTLTFILEFQHYHWWNTWFWMYKPYQGTPLYLEGDFPWHRIASNFYREHGIDLMHFQRTVSLIGPNALVPYFGGTSTWWRLIINFMCKNSTRKRTSVSYVVVIIDKSSDIKTRWPISFPNN